MGRKIKWKIEESRKAKIRSTTIDGGQARLWRGLNIALDKEVAHIPSEIQWGIKSFTTNSGKVQAFADFFCAKTKDIVVQNTVQDSMADGDRVVFAEAVNYVTLEKTR